MINPNIYLRPDYDDNLGSTTAQTIQQAQKAVYHKLYNQPFKSITPGQWIKRNGGWVLLPPTAPIETLKIEEVEEQTEKGRILFYLGLATIGYFVYKIFIG